MVLLTSDTSTVSGILQMATELGTWVIEMMSKFITFITSNPIVLIMFIIGLVGAGVGFLMRIWHSA